MLAARTENYRQWLTSYTKRCGVAVLRAPKSARKEAVAAPNHRRFRGNQGLVVVLTSMEQSPTFISYSLLRSRLGGCPPLETIRAIILLVLALQGLILAVAAISTFLRPARAASMYSVPNAADGENGRVVDPAFVLCMVPLQGVVAALMLWVSIGMALGFESARSASPFVLAVLALMELAFVLVRYRSNALRGNAPWWLLRNRDSVVTLRGVLTSLLLTVVYAAGALAFMTS